MDAKLLRVPRENHSLDGFLVRSTAAISLFAAIADAKPLHTFAAIALTLDIERGISRFAPNLETRQQRVPVFFIENIRCFIMAKATTIKVKMLSTEGTGFFYTAKKNSRTMTEKMVMRKYDPVVRKHVEFKEAKIK